MTMRLNFRSVAIKTRRVHRRAVPPEAQDLPELRQSAEPNPLVLNGNWGSGK